MNHRIFGKKLGRNTHERHALFNAQMKSMFLHGSIETTEAKAKSVTHSLEKLGHKVLKYNDLLSHRQLERLFNDRELVNRVHRSFTEAFKGTTTNLTTMQRVKIRKGDGSIMVKLAFTKPYTLAAAKVKEAKVKAVKAKSVAKPVVKKPAAKKL